MLGCSEVAWGHHGGEGGQLHFSVLNKLLGHRALAKGVLQPQVSENPWDSPSSAAIPISGASHSLLRPGGHREVLL